MIAQSARKAAEKHAEVDSFMLKFDFEFKEILPGGDMCGLPVAPNPFIVMFRDDGYGGWVPFLCSRHFRRRYK